uniref:Uncharacterized protein n=1 Tax=Rhizophora mucronata TaxID=61149 RepID=A0A2P2P5X9_RHIMU
MQQADRTRMQIPAKPSIIVTAEPMLVPTVIDRGYVPCKNKQDRRLRAELVDPNPLLQLHPFDDLLRVIALSPSFQINDHYPGVEVAWIASRKCRRQRRIGPERRREVRCEVGIAILGCSQDRVVAQGRGCQLCYVIHED